MPKITVERHVLAHLAARCGKKHRKLKDQGETILARDFLDTERNLDTILEGDEDEFTLTY